MAFDISNLDQPGGTYLAGLQNLSGGDESNTSGMDIGNLLSGVAKAFNGFTLLNEGMDIAKAGADFTAGVYRSAGQTSIQGAAFTAQVNRQAGQAAIAAANYNIALDQLQTSRQQDALSRQLNFSLSSNYAKIGSSGIGFGSKSSMMVQNDVVSTAERQFTQNKNDAAQRQSVLDYEGKLTQTQYENAARAAEYSGQVAAQQAENNARAAEYQGEIDTYKAGAQQAQMIGGAVSNIFSAIGGL